MSHLSWPALVKWIGAFLFAQWLSLAAPSRNALITLVCLMALDYATGLMSAWIKGEIDSSVGRKGLLQKCMTILLIVTCHVVEKGTGLELHLEVAGAIGFSVNEFISIIENCAKAGVWVPGQVVHALVAIKKIKASGATAEQLRELSSGELYVGPATVDQIRAIKKAVEPAEGEAK